MLLAFLALATTAALVAPPTLTATVLGDTPGGSVPRGALRVPMLTLELSASCEEDIPLKSIILFHEGRGDRSNILGVYAAEGPQRLNRRTAFSSKKGEVLLRFRNFSIPACEKRTLTILADFSADAASGSEHRITLRSSSDIAADARIILAPLLTHLSVRPVGPSDGTITVSYPPLTMPVRYGTDRIVSRIALQADETDDHTITALTLINNGKARNADLQHLFLESARRRPLTPLLPHMDGNRARFTFDPPLFLPKNTRILLTLRADILASRRKTINFLVEEEGDIEARPVHLRTH